VAGLHGQETAVFQHQVNDMFDPAVPPRFSPLHRLQWEEAQQKM
jgi:hypothetical protein